MTETVNRQESPYPHILKKIVESVEYKGWHIYLTAADFDRGQGCRGLTLIVMALVPDAYHRDEMIRINHLFPVPPAAYDHKSWRRWLFDRIADVETHEAMEFFMVDGGRPFAPRHQPGADPYVVHELATEAEQRTTAWGEVR